VTTVPAQRLQGTGTAYLTHSGPSTFVLFGGTFTSPLLGHGKFHEDGTFTGNQQWTAKGTMTAANGDTLTFRSVGGVRSSTSTVAHSSTNETVIGGTGRFAGATGAWTTTADTVVTTQGTLVLQTNKFRFTGTLALKN
jgi:hypothetical protein